MSNSELLFSKQEEGELLSLLKTGKVILFVGAGFSMGAKNILGNQIPNGETLSKLMNEEIIKRPSQIGFSEADSKNLKIVSETYFNVYKDRLQSINFFFYNNLTVDDETLPIEYNDIKLIDWKNIYTTNFDNLLEVIYRKGSYNKAVYKKNDTKEEVDNTFNIVYLNGDLNVNARENPNAKNLIITDVICSSKEYISTKKSLLWENFLTKFKQHHIIFLGTQLLEDILSDLIESSSTLSSFNFSQRPRSYLINFDEPNSRLSTLKNDFNIVHKKGTTTEFLKWLSSHFSSTANTVSSIEEGKITSSTNINYTEFTKQYWDDKKGQKSELEKLKYYTSINSSDKLLPFIIADGFYVEPNEEMIVKSLQGNVIKDLESLLPTNGINHNTIIWINANGGAGKSTLLYHIGKKYAEKYHIIYFSKIGDEVFTLPNYKNDEIPVIILLDNYGKEVDKLEQFLSIIHGAYNECGFCFITTERHITNHTLREYSLDQIDEAFPTKSLTFQYDSHFYSKIFDKIIDFIDVEKQINELKKNHLKQQFITPIPSTTAERILELLFSLEHDITSLKNFTFDWEDWDKLCTSPQYSPYQSLYGIVAAFNNYDITPPIKLCIDLLGIDDKTSYKTLSLFNPDYDFPISIVKAGYFELRNPVLSKWYINKKDRNNTQTKKYFIDALNNLDNAEKMYVLRKSYRNEPFLNDFIRDPAIEKGDLLKRLVPTDKQVLLKKFTDYVRENPNDIEIFKHKMEIIIINLILDNDDEAKILLEEMIKDDDVDTRMHARAKLADILIGEGNYIEAEKYVDYLVKEDKDKDNRHVRQLQIALLNNPEVSLEYIEAFFKNIPKEEITSVRRVLKLIVRRYILQEEFIKAQEYVVLLINDNIPDYDAIIYLNYILNKLGNDIDAKKLKKKFRPIYPQQFFVLQCQFANWLKDNLKFEEALSVLLHNEPPASSSDDRKLYYYHILADTYLKKITSEINLLSHYTDSDKSSCENACAASLNINKHHERSLHTLYFLNYVLFNHATKKSREKRMYASQYRSYLGKLFLANKKSEYAVKAISEHLLKIERYRLGIAFFKKYGDLENSPKKYVKELKLMYVVLGNKFEFKKLQNIYDKDSLNDTYEFRYKRELISQDSIGTIYKNQIMDKEAKYNIPNQILSSYLFERKVKHHEMFFFGIYVINDEKVIDNIEPYFESLPDDETILDLLELTDKTH